MLDRNYTLEQIVHEVRRIVFRRVLNEERKLRGDTGSKGRAAIRLGVHRNTVTRELWPRVHPPLRLREMLNERDPPMSLNPEPESNQAYSR
jgi:hypothetical protein